MSWHGTEGTRIQKIISSLATQMAGEAIIQLLSAKFEAGWEHFLDAIVESDKVAINSSLSAQEIQLERERVAQQKEAMRQRAEQERQKNEAWERFYTPAQACELPESQARVDVYTAREARFRKEFEQLWAAGEFSQPRA
ncbi:DUF1654 domain-containing protein [Azotobacter salinestris]|uniref:DUF1654 domain-containing protein n=1 Tax=Azotobacter salinestris TaxID=69964 RepID=UPI001266A925|nr:DUF1654 domain-containing protein [Azotobacter salinestris]